jgi:hypothetical protein
LNDQYQVLAFGTKIVRRHGASQVTEVIVTEPIEGAPRWSSLDNPEAHGTFRRRSS